MVYVLVHFSIQDYSTWQSVFDDRVETREEWGATGEEFVFRNTDDPNELFVIMGWDDLEKARSFTQSDVLREGMQQAGVVGRPTMYFLEEGD